MGETARYGIIGLGVMGRNLAANVSEQGLPLTTYSFSASERRDVGVSHPQLHVSDSLSAFVSALGDRRVVFLMVTAGSAVDEVLHSLLERLGPGDVIIDGGNSHYLDTERRVERCAQHEILFIGVGVSGGALGARHGASVMVGGDEQSFARVEPLFAAIACKVGDESCHGWMGRAGAGHFVKMVHNGIEYGIMQLIAESYDYLRRGVGLSVEEIHDWFEGQSSGPLASYLMDITAAILVKRDDLSSGLLLDQVSDRAGQKGTGRWCVAAALELGVAVPTIMAAVTERQISAQHELRNALRVDDTTPPKALHEHWQKDVQAALTGGMLATFAQGIDLICAADAANKWGTDVRAAIRLWRGGCIIRAAMLDQLLACDDLNQHLFLSDSIGSQLTAVLPGWRTSIASAQAAGVPVPALGTSLAYVDSLSAARLPTHLIQAQRDCFGAHTFERLDRSGSFHADWLVS